MGKGQGLIYYKWYFDKTRELEGFVKAGLLTLEQAAEIFFAVQAYAESGEIREMSSAAVTMQYKSLCTDADRARQAYDLKVEKLQDNGSKGGKAKAANAKAKAAAAPQDPAAPPSTPSIKFTPPTLTQFKNAVAHFNENEWDEEAECSDYEIESLYDKLKESGWNWKGRYKIQNRRDWELLAQERFEPYKINEISAWNVFTAFAEKYPFDTTFTQLYEAYRNFAGCSFEEHGIEVWRFTGKPITDPIEAVVRFIEQEFEKKP